MELTRRQTLGWAAGAALLGISGGQTAHAAAAKQVGDYYEGKNGLASHAADDGPKVTKVTYEEYLRNR